MNKRGYFLVEAIVSITVVAIVITILFANMTKSYVNESNETTKYNTTEGLYTAKEVRKVLKEQVETFKTSLGTKAYIDVTDKMSSETTALDIKYIYFTTYDTENLLKSNAKIPILVKQSLSKPSEQTDNCSYRYIIIFNDNSYSSIGAECNTDDYSLTVVPNGGTWNGSQQAQKFVQLGGTTKKIDALSNTGTYEISYNRNGQGASFDASPTSVPRPFKKWKKSGGGTFEKSTNTYTFGGKNGILTATYGYATFNLPTIAKTGYTCYWRKGSPSGEQYTSGAEVSINDNTNFYAYCEKNPYTLNVNPNGGTWEGSTSGRVITQLYDTTRTIANPSRSCYDFNRWAFSGTQYGTLNTSTKEYRYGAGDDTIVAQWTGHPYTATFNGNSGTSSQSSRTVNYNSTLGTLPSASRSCYTHKGWYTAASGGNKISSSTTMPCSNTTYYAQWDGASYTATFNGNGGTSSESTRSVKYGNSIGSLPSATRDGYTFLGWYTAASGGNKISSGTTMPCGNQIYYAHWQLNSPSCYVSVIGGNKYNSWYNSPPTILGTFTGAELSQKGLALGGLANNWVTSFGASEGNNTYYCYVANAAGDYSNNATVNVDTTPPSCINKSCDSWDEDGAYCEADCSDSNSGCTSSWDSVQSTSNSSISFTDKANNTGSCSFTVTSKTQKRTRSKVSETTYGAWTDVGCKCSGNTTNGCQVWLKDLSTSTHRCITKDGCGAGCYAQKRTSSTTYKWSSWSSYSDGSCSKAEKDASSCSERTLYKGSF